MINISEFQYKVLLPGDQIDYSRLITGAYSASMMATPFVGLKFLCRDTRARIYGNPSQRMAELDKFCPQILSGANCFMRETHMNIPDGLWVVSFPVPRNQINEAINGAINVLMKLNSIGVTFSGMLEINVSGLCRRDEVPNMIQNIIVPKEYEKYLIQPDSAFKLAKPYTINDSYTLLRTKWNVSNSRSNIVNAAALKEFSVLMSQLIASAFH